MSQILIWHINNWIIWAQQGSLIPAMGTSALAPSDLPSAEKLFILFINKLNDIAVATLID